MSTSPADVALPEDREKSKVEKRSSIALRWRQLLAQREMGIFLVVLAGAIFLNFASTNFLNSANLIALVVGLSIIGSMDRSRAPSWTKFRGISRDRGTAGKLPSPRRWRVAKYVDCPTAPLPPPSPKSISG